MDNTIVYCPNWLKSVCFWLKRCSFFDHERTTQYYKTSLTLQSIIRRGYTKTPSRLAKSFMEKVCIDFKRTQIEVQIKTFTFYFRILLWVCFIYHLYIVDVVPESGGKVVWCVERKISKSVLSSTFPAGRTEERSLQMVKLASRGKNTMLYFYMHVCPCIWPSMCFIIGPIF